MRTPAECDGIAEDHLCAHEPCSVDVSWCNAHLIQSNRTFELPETPSERVVILQ